MQAVVTLYFYYVNEPYYTSKESRIEVFTSERNSECYALLEKRILTFDLGEFTPEKLAERQVESLRKTIEEHKSIYTNHLETMNNQLRQYLSLTDQSKDENDGFISKDDEIPF